MRTFFCIIICSIFLEACQNKQFEPYGVPEGITISRSTPIDYHFVKFYSLYTCVHCHKERTQPDLSDYESVKKHVHKIMDEVSDGSMPPTEDGSYLTLSTCQIEVLQNWINQGMPETDGNSIMGSSTCF